MLLLIQCRVVDIENINAYITSFHSTVVLIYRWLSRFYYFHIKLHSPTFRHLYIVFMFHFKMSMFELDTLTLLILSHSHYVYYPFYSFNSSVFIGYIGWLNLIDPYKYLVNMSQMKLTLFRWGYLAMVTNLILHAFILFFFSETILPFFTSFDILFNLLQKGVKVLGSKND